METISDPELAALRTSFLPLIGLRLSWLAIPDAALVGFEPSQLAVIVNTLLDGASLVLRHVRQNGRISNISFRRLTGHSYDQGITFFKRAVTSGVLERKGKAAGTHYVIPGRS